MAEKNSLVRLSKHGLEILPDNWSLSKVKYLGDYINGYPFKPTDWALSGRPILRIQNLTSPETEANKYDGELPEKYLVRSGDYLISWSASLGVFNWQGEDAWLNQHIFKVIINTELITPFYFYWASNWFIGELGRDVHGSTMQHLTADAFGSFPVPIPPFNIQIEISSYLDRETAHIDSLIQAKENLLVKLAEKRQALITQAVTRGLDPDVRLKPSGVDWLGDVPEHWEVKKLKHVAEVRGGIAVGKNYQTKRVTPFPYLRVANVQDGKLSLEDIKTIEVPADEAVSYFLEAGDVLMNEGGDSDKLGRGAIWDGSISPCLHQNHVFAVRPFGITSLWLNMWTSSEIAKAYFESRAKKATNLASISSSNLKELFVLLPSQQEQLSIVNWIEKQMNHLDDVQEKTTDSINLLKERRSALITAAVTGQIDVIHSNVNQETTSSRASVV